MATAYYDRPVYFASGPVRGDGYERRTAEAARADCERDAAACARLGGGAYSDRRVAVRMGSDVYFVGEGSVCFPRRAIVAAVSEEIAEGNGVRRPRLKRDDWSGWIVTSIRGRRDLWRVKARWPDGEDYYADFDISHVCGLE